MPSLSHYRPTIARRRPPAPPKFTPVLHFAYDTFWRVSLLFICLPAWLLGLALVWTGYLSMEIGYIVRDRLEAGNNVLETRFPQ